MRKPQSVRRPRALDRVSLEALESRQLLSGVFLDASARAGRGPVTFADTALAPAAPSTYAIPAFNGDAGPDLEGPVTAATPAGAGTGTTPNTPFALSATAVSPTSIDVTFYDNSDDETQFVLIRTQPGLGGRFGFTLPAHAGRGFVTYHDTGLAPGVPYAYTIQAFNGDRGSNLEGPVTAATPPGAASGTGATPNTPFALSAGADSATQARFTFYDNSDDETSFLVLRTGGGSVQESTVPAHAGRGFTTFVDPTTQPGTTYGYTVQAFNGDRGSNVAGPVNVTTPGAGPGGGPVPGTGGGDVTNRPFALSATATSPTSVTFQFYDNSDDEMSFVVHRATNPDFLAPVSQFALPAHAGRGFVTFVDNSANPKTTYYYSVSAIKNLTGTPSAETAVVTTPLSGGNPPALDSSFGAGGAFVDATQPPGLGTVVTSDHKIIVLESDSIARYNADGTIDAAFGTAGTGHAPFAFFGGFTPAALTLEFDGRIVVAGVTGGSAFIVEQFNTDGTPYFSFGDNGFALAPTPNHLTVAGVTVDRNGRVVVAGTGSTPNALFGPVVARFNVDGTRDAGFGTNGLYSAVGGRVQVNAVAADLSNRPILAGSVIGGTSDSFYLQRLTPAGVPDGTAFDVPLGGSGFNFLNGVAVQQGDNKIVAVGNRTQVVFRFNSDGSADTSFGVNGQATLPAPNGANSVRFQNVLEETSGKLLVGGVANFGANADDFILARYNADGTLDSTFGTGGIVLTDLGGDDVLNGLSRSDTGLFLAVGASNQHLALARYFA